MRNSILPLFALALSIFALLYSLHVQQHIKQIHEETYAELTLMLNEAQRERHAIVVEAASTCRGAFCRSALLGEEPTFGSGQDAWTLIMNRCLRGESECVAIGINAFVQTGNEHSWIHS